MPASIAPLIVQGNLTVLLDLASPEAEPARTALAQFAELKKSPAHIHTYQVTPLSVWNACASGFGAAPIVEALESFSRFPIPSSVTTEIEDLARRFGTLTLNRRDDQLELLAQDLVIAEDLAGDPQLKHLLTRTAPLAFSVSVANRGRVKLALIKLGLPICDNAGFVEGAPLAVDLATHMRNGTALSLRDYQKDAASAFSSTGSGVVVLPCGAGKTIVGMASIARLKTSTLILTTSTTAVRQWIDELLDKTDLSEAQIGEYTGASKSIREVTVATYQVLTHRKTTEDEFTHMALFDSREWGLIIYDEVHLLPAPVFQTTASLQARRRLGLTATLVREDGLERDVFALIGPKCWDMPWKELEAMGWIAQASCTEVRLPLPSFLRAEYSQASDRQKLKVAAENPDKLALVQYLLGKHPGQPTLIIGTFLSQLDQLATELSLPVITGATPQSKREELFAGFRAGAIPALIVSKVANFAIDLPDASVAIQVSGTFGSRQEEAQRLGRLLRPKQASNNAYFYTLVTRDTREEEYAHRRQLFLCEQGYEYSIVQHGEALAP